MMNRLMRYSCLLLCLSAGLTACDDDGIDVDVYKRQALRAFKRVHIPAGKTVDVEFDLGDKELVWWNPQSNTMCVSEGSYELMVGGSSQTAGLLRRSFVIQP